MSTDEVAITTLGPVLKGVAINSIACVSSSPSLVATSCDHGICCLWDLRQPTRPASVVTKGFTVPTSMLEAVFGAGAKLQSETVDLAEMTDHPTAGTIVTAGPALCKVDWRAQAVSATLVHPEFAQGMEWANLDRRCGQRSSSFIASQASARSQDLGLDPHSVVLEYDSLMMAIDDAGKSFAVDLSDFSLIGLDAPETSTMPSAQRKSQSAGQKQQSKGGKKAPGKKQGSPSTPAPVPMPWLRRSQRQWSLKSAIGGHASIGCGVAPLPHHSSIFSVGMEGQAQVLDMSTGRRIGESLAVGNWGGAVGDAPSSNDMNGQGQAQAVQQLANPPVPTCVDVVQRYAVVGRGDGTFSIVDLEPGLAPGQTVPWLGPVTASSEDGDLEARLGQPEVILEAPGHATNGLAAVEWCCGVNTIVPPMLLTAAVSGEVFVWKTAEELGGGSSGHDENETPDEGNGERSVETGHADENGEEEEEEEEGLPCTFAFDMRIDNAASAELGGADVVLNTATMMRHTPTVAIGDSAGRLMLIPLA